jgi:hypothetical protein
MRQSVTIVMGKMDVKYFRIKRDRGTKCHLVVLAKNVVGRMFTCDILPLKSVLKKHASGWTHNPCTLRPNVTVDVLKHRTLLWVDNLWVARRY